MSVLITGAGGMIGSHLAEKLFEEGVETISTYHQATINLATVNPEIEFLPLDVCDRNEVFNTIDQHRPAEIYHLAAQSLPTVSWVDPWTTMRVNVEGTINVFEAVISVRKKDPAYDPMTVVACSSAEYGASLTPDRVPVSEDAPLMPMHPYGVSKVAQDQLAFQYFKNHGLRSIRARIFNCTGPRKCNDVASDFAKRIVKCLHEGGVLRHGSLETSRSITDVRDMVQALIALARMGRPGEAYNIGGDRAYPISEILDLLFDIVGRRIPTERDPALMRPSDEPVIFGDTSKLRADTDWRQAYTLRQTLTDMLAFEEQQHRAHADAC